MTYYAIQTEPGRLPVVRQLLRRAGHDCYLPAEIRYSHRRKKRLIVPMMPYLFVKAPHLFSKAPPKVQALWMHQIKAVRHVKGFVAMTRLEGPIPLADDKIDVLRRSIDDWRSVERARKTLSGLRKGGKAVVKHGPLAGRKGTVTWVSGNRAKLEAFIFGTSRVVTVQVDQLEAA